MIMILLQTLCILVLSAVSTIRAEGEVRCSQNCTCLLLENVFIQANCSRLGWTTIPPDLPYTLKLLDLSHNRLTSLTFKDLSKVKNLIHLNVSFNNITTLEDRSWNIIGQTYDLDFDCGNTDVGKGSLQLPTGDRKEKDVVLKKTLSSIRYLGQWWLQTLDISNNLLTDIANNTFRCLTLLQTLNISHNAITTLNPMPFSGLRSLVYLDLSDNRIPLSAESYPEEVFSPLGNLRDLSLLGNKIPQGRGWAHNLTFAYPSSWSYPDKALQHLTSLQTLHIDGLPGDAIPGTGFKKLTQLSFLDIGSFRGLCTLGSLPEYFFSNIATKKPIHVSLQSCKLSSIHPDAFSYLPTLTSLSLRNNHILGFDKFMEGSLSLNKTRIKTLDLTRINLWRRRYVKLLAQWFQHLQYTSLETLIVDNNGIMDIELKLAVILPRSLKMFSLANNKIIWIREIFTIYWLENLQIIDLSIQNKFTEYGLAKKIDTFEYTESGSNLYELSDGINLSSAAQKEKPDDNSTITSNETSAYRSSLINRRKDPDISYDLISHDTLRQLQTSVCPSIKARNITWSDKDVVYVISRPNGLQRMRRLVTRQNISVSKPFSNPIPIPRSLKKIYLNEAKLGLAIPKLSFLNNVLEHLELADNFLYCFDGPMYGLRNLKYLDLSNNYCIALNPLFFSDMPKLETLLLTFNTLGPSLETDENGTTFSNMASLKYIDISHNDIRVLHQDAFSNTGNLQTILLNNNAINEFNTNIGHLINLTLLDLSGNAISTVSHATMENIENILSVSPTLKIDILNNPLRCDCTTIAFLNWFQLRKVIFRRRSLYKCQFINGTHVKLEDIAEFYTPLWKRCNGTTFLVLALSGLFLMLILWSGFGIYCIYRVKLLFYIYISKRLYDDDEPQWRRFVFNVVRPSLEDRGVSCFISEIEPMAGKPLKMTDSITSVHLSTAKKTLVLLTRDLFVIEDHELEVNMAMLSEEMRMSKVLYFLLLEDCPPDCFPPHLRECIEKTRPVVYNRNNPQFWDHFARMIKSPSLF
ncbi:unnamed protein product [Candidula unifasciata]|uniref:TIR domain-containing protein n=1 Tax=Candidula unifasciata TaxID=100452 RepID=A0A8S3ZEB3_9EUPU|nr:unnamed protein product [Candidula unifasciata]